MDYAKLPISARWKMRGAGDEGGNYEDEEEQGEGMMRRRGRMRNRREARRRGGGGGGGGQAVDRYGAACEGDGGDANSRLGVDEQLIASSADCQLGRVVVNCVSTRLGG